MLMKAWYIATRRLRLLIFYDSNFDDERTVREMEIDVYPCFMRFMRPRHSWCKQQQYH